MLKLQIYRIISWIKSTNNHKLTVALIALVIILLTGGFFVFQKYQNSRPLLSDILLNFDPEGTFATLTPRRDGNALVLNIKRVAAFDSFAYQLTYVDRNDIDRGAGSLDTWIDLKDKGEFEQELLLGTCSQGFTEGKAHCVFDEGVENGTLILRIRKGLQPYRMLSQWHLQKPDLALGNLTSGDNHFSYVLKNTKREDLSLIGFSIVNDLTGAPKLPSDKQILGKVYSLTSPIARDLMGGKVSLELSENPPLDAKIARYTDKGNSWEELDTKITGSKLEAIASGSGIFTVLINKQ